MNQSSKCHGNEKFQSYTNVEICGWAGQRWKALGSFCCSFLQFRENNSVLCVCCGSAGILSQHGDSVLIKFVWLKPNQNQCSRGTQGAFPGILAFILVLVVCGQCEGSEMICSSWELRYKSIPTVPFCNMQIIMNICIFLHFCVWYMYYLRQML